MTNPSGIKLQKKTTESELFSMLEPVANQPMYPIIVPGKIDSKPIITARKNLIQSPFNF